jgi:three-Cys-motif partner protein
MPPSDTLWVLEPHSLAKHHILRRYVNAWLPIMTRFNDKVVLVDAFAGPGRYLGGEPGSPLILLDCYLNHKYRDHMRSEIVYLFIEERHDRVAHLNSEIEKIDTPKNVKVHVMEGRYEDVFRRELDDLRAAGKSIAPTFAFVDPFGYSEAPMDLTGQFMQFDRCEALIYMPLPFVARFVGREGQERAMTSLFGTDDWRRAIDMSGDDRRQFLHDLFRDQLQRQGSDFVRSFEIESAQGNGYHLFFGTSHRLGLERMKEAMWSLDPAEGGHFTDSTRRDQLVLFEPQPNLEPLRTQLRERFGSKEFTIEQAIDFTLLHTQFIETHLRGVLRPDERDERLEVLSTRIRRLTYPEGTRLRFLP